MPLYVCVHVLRYSSWDVRLPWKLLIDKVKGQNMLQIGENDLHTAGHSYLFISSFLALQGFLEL